MRMPTKREWLLLSLAPLVILADFVVDRGDREAAMSVADAAPIVKTRSEPSRVVDLGDLDVSQLHREASVADPGNVFVGKSWYVPPPPPPPPPPVVVVPTAPPLPFTYMGRFDDAAKPVIFLVRSDRVLLVSAGDVIEGTYRVDGIVGTALGLTYLPLNIRQNLYIGGTE